MKNPKPTSRISDAAGTTWAYLQSWAARGISLIVFFVLARVLSPHEFGTFAIAVIFLTIGEIFVEQLFGPAIIQRESLTTEHLNSAFWTTIFLGSVFASGTYFFAPHFAELFDSTNVTLIIQSLAPIPIFMALASVPAALLHRALDYRTLAKRTALSNLFSGAAAIAAACAGFGIWTFVIQQVIYQLISTAVLWRNSTWRPSWTFSFIALRQLASFSVRVTLGKLFDLIETRVVELIAAKYLGINALGNFTLAARAQMAATQLIAAPLWLSSVSVFARKQSDKVLLLASLQDRTQIVALFICPIFLIAASTGEALVPALFGEQWLDAASAFQILCILGALRSFTSLYGSLLQAIGAGDSIAINSFARTAATICTLPFLIKYGPIGVAGSLLVGQAITLPVILFGIKKYADLESNQLLSRATRHIFSAIASASIGLYTTKFLLANTTHLLSALGGMFIAFTTFLSLIILTIGAQLIVFARLLPSGPSKNIIKFLERIEYFKMTLRVKIFTLGIHFAKKPSSSHQVERSVIIVGACRKHSKCIDFYQSGLLGMLEILKLSGETKVRLVCPPGSSIPPIAGVTLTTLPTWDSIQSARAMVSELASCKALIFLEENHRNDTNFRSQLILQLAIANYATRKNISIILCDPKVKEYFDQCLVETIRNCHSKAYLVNDGISQLRSIAGDLRTNISSIAGPSYFLPPTQNSEFRDHLRIWRNNRTPDTQSIIGFSFQTPSLEHRVAAAKSYAIVVERIIQKKDAAILLISYAVNESDQNFAFHTEIISNLAEELKSSILLIQEPRSPADTKDVLGELTLFISDRVDLISLALGNCSPVLVVEHNEPITSDLINFELSEEHYISQADSMNPEFLYLKIFRIFEQEASIKKNIGLRLLLIRDATLKYYSRMLGN